MRRWPSWVRGYWLKAAGLPGDLGLSSWGRKLAPWQAAGGVRPAALAMEG